MIIFVYDKTFEGLLTAVFDAYSRRTFPDLLVTEGEPFLGDDSFQLFFVACALIPFYT